MLVALAETVICWSSGGLGCWYRLSVGSILCGNLLAGHAVEDMGSKRSARRANLFVLQGSMTQDRASSFLRA